MDLLWPPACTGYPGTDNNTDNNENYDHRDSDAYLSLIVQRKRSHEICPATKIITNVK
jgi:hypothetical protein